MLRTVRGGLGIAAALLGAGFLAATASAVAAAGAETPPADVPAGTLAVVDGVPISAGEIDAAIAGQLTDLRNREYNLRAQALEDRIGRLLLEKEAAARKLSVKDLEKAEIDDKVAVTDEEAKGFYEANKARFGARPEEEALKQVHGMLGQQKGRERRQAFLRELRAKAGVKVLLEPLRVPVAEGGGAIRGPRDAAVTIVEFSDFQCPYCSRAKPTLDRVRDTYGDRVRLVFRDFPLPIHPLAPKAAEAGACAKDQGKFWEMHDRLFDQQQKLAVADLKQHAKELGLDAAAFDECLDSGRHAADVQKDAAEGARYGVTGTPAFFVNGRPLVGAQPYEGFAQVIDDELDRKGLPRPPAKPAPPRPAAPKAPEEK
jgi:predicted DsbA family dithiol-disulfide isomerase